MVTPKYINLRPVFGRGAMINIIEAPRGVGKTFTSKAWLLKRFLKTGHKFIWVRRTEEETLLAKQSFFAKKKLLRKVGLTPEQVKVKGNYGFIKCGRKWVDCVEFCSLSTTKKHRSNDDESYDVMIVDEAFATPDAVSMFRGNEVTAFIDLYITKKRDHDMKVFIFGNKEIINNPYYQYFGITPPPHGFSGIRMFRDNTLLVWTMTEYVKTADHDKVASLLAGTPYYDYMFTGAAKTQCVERFGEKPKRARYWCSFDFGVPFTVWRTNGTYYVRAGVDKSRMIFICRETRGRYDREMIVGKADKARFLALDTAARRNKIVYSDPLMAETASAVFERLGIFR